MAFADKERPGFLESQRGGDAGVVAERGMGVEREMGAVDGEVVFHQEPEEFAAFAGPWNGASPEESVVDDEEIGPGFDSFLHGGEGRVHRRGDAGDGTVVADLESVVRAVVVAELGGAKGRVAVTDNSGEWGGGHARS